MSQWLFNMYVQCCTYTAMCKDRVVRERNARVLGRVLEHVGANTGGLIETYQPLIADGSELVANSEEKLRRLVSEFIEFAKE